MIISAVSVMCTALKAQRVVKYADHEASLNNYMVAKPLYERAYNETKSVNAARGLAQIYLHTRNYVYAESWYAKLVSMPGHKPEDKLHYAEALINNSKYDEAKMLLADYLNEQGADEYARNLLFGCEDAVKWLAAPIVGELKNMRNLNTEFSEWGAVKLKNDLIFASDKRGDAIPGKSFFSGNKLNREFCEVLRFNIEGNVIYSITKMPLKNAVVTLHNKNTGTPEKIVTDEKGYYFFKLDSLSDYSLDADKSRYASVKEIDFTTRGLTDTKNITKIITLSEVKIDTAYRLNGIYFDLDKTDIRPGSEADLNYLVKLLNDNPTWIVELSSHTDSRGNDKYNMNLSQRRSQSVVQYLTQKGVDKERMLAKGYGETRQVNRCADGVKCT